MMSKYVVAIDLGTTKVVSLVGEKLDGGRYRIVAYSEAPSNGIRRGQVEHITKVVNSVVPTLEKIKTDAEIVDIENVYVGIAGQHITCIENRVEKIRDKYDEIITKEEITELETKAGKLHLNPDSEILHIIPQNYSIDEQSGITDPAGRLGNKLTGHFYVVIGNKSNRIHTNSCLKFLNLSLNKLILEPIASARAVLSDDEKELGVAMIDIGGGTTDLIVYKDYTIVHTAVIPFGGNVITEDIKTMCSIKYEDAEQIKIKYGLQAKPHDYVQVKGISGREPRELPFDIILKVITSRLNEIIDMVLYEIVNKTQCGKLGAGIVITGGVSKMKGIKEFLIKRLKEQAELEPEIKQRIETEVIISSPQYILHDSDSGKNTIIHPKYSTAVGLVMCGFDHLESLELTPEQKEAQRRREEEEAQRKREEEERLRREEEERLKREEEERLKREEEERLKREEEERLKREEEERLRREEEEQKNRQKFKSLTWIKNAVKDIGTFLQAQKEEKND